jgi:hypothetical protein
MNAIVTDLVLLAPVMQTVTIVAVVALSVQPLTPALVGKTLQFAFIVHALRRLTPLQQYLLSWD